MSGIGYGEDKPAGIPEVPPEFRHGPPAPPDPGQHYPGQPYPGPHTPGQHYPGPPQYGAPQYGAPQYAAPNPSPPAPPRRRRRWVVPVAIVAGALLVAAVTATVALAVRGGDPHASPEAAVRSFYGDLAAGRAERAVAALSSRPTGDPALLTDAAYRDGGGGISSVRLGTTTRRGDTATVVATIRSRTGTSTLGVAVRRGVDGWRVDPSVIGRISLVTALPSGSRVDFGSTRIDLRTAVPALPGSYRFRTDTTGPWVASETVTASVGVATGGDTARLRFTSPLTAAGKAQAGAAVQSFLDSCIAQTTLHTTGGCGFGLGAQDGTTYTDIHWTATRRPVPRFDAWTGHGWSVSASTLGAFHVEATYHAGTDSGPATGDFTDAPLGGVVSVDSSGTWRYVSTLPDVT